MKNLKKVALFSFAIIAVAAITFLTSSNELNIAKINSQVEVSITDNTQLASIDWANYDFNSIADAEKCGSGKCGDDKKKSDSKTDSKTETKSESKSGKA